MDIGLNKTHYHKTKTQQCCKQGYIFNTSAHHGGVQGIGMLWKNLNVIFYSIILLMCAYSTSVAMTRMCHQQH